MGTHNDNQKHRNAYKNTWSKENQELISTRFSKSDNIAERIKNASNTKGLSASAYVRKAILDALERDGY